MQVFLYLLHAPQNGWVQQKAYFKVGSGAGP